MTSKRNISATNEAALNAQVVRPILFARIDFASGVQRFHTEIGPRSATHPVFGTEVYEGIGDFGGISSEVTESIAGAPAGLSISLSGVDSALVNTALVDDYYRRSVEILLGLEDENATLVDDPIILWSGLADKADISLNDGLGDITLRCESRAINGLRPTDPRFTDEDKQAEVTGDLFGEYIYRMRDITLRWGDSAFRSGITPSPPPDFRFIRLTPP